MTDRSDRVPPHSIEAEQSLLGCILLRPSVFLDLGAQVDPGDFYKSSHQHIYAQLLTMFDNGEVIDCVTVGQKLKVSGQLESIGGLDYLIDLTNATPALSRTMAYANIVIEASRRRASIRFFTERAQECYEESTAVEEIISRGADPDALMMSRTNEVKGLAPIGDFMAIQAEEHRHRPWLIPHVMKSMWRTIVVAPEGIGKAVFMRFLALHAAAGRDPWSPSRFIDPVRCLYIDVENSPESIYEQFALVNRRDDLVTEAAGNLHVWSREGGLNLRDRRPRVELERVIQQTHPQIIFAGPLYKLYRRSGREDFEQAALEFVEVLDDLRSRYKFALMLEHHAPKGQGGSNRDLNPFGSSLFLRWPEFGLTLEPVGNITHDTEDYVLEIGRFRRDRQVADWPNEIRRGAPMATTAWTPRWAGGRGDKLRLTYIDGEWHHVDE